MIDYDYPDLFLGDAVTKDFIITDGEVEVINDDSWAITAEATVAIRNVDLESESFELHQSLNSEMQLRFGSCESAYISFVCHSAWWGDIANLKGKVLNVYIIPNNHATKIIQIGVFKVQENKLTNDRKARKITAYDAMYDILNSDVADWYNNVAFMPIPIAPEPSVAMSSFRNFFLAYFGLEAEETTLVNDSIVLHKTINPETLSGADVIKAICEINGVFGMITNEGKFRFVELASNIREDSEDVTDIEVSHYIDVEYEDYDSLAITGVKVITNKETKFFASAETPENIYTINGNFLISDYQGTDLFMVARTLAPKLYNHYYQPLTVNALGNPVHEVGDAIKVILKDGTELPTYILERNLRGIQALRDTYTAKGEEEAGESLNSTSSRYTQLENNAIQAATEAATVASTTDFVEVIRNIGFRLLDEPSNVSVEYDEVNQQVELSWTDPSDIATNEPSPATWEGTVVVRNENHAPLNRWDGTLIEDSTTRDEYSETPLVDDTIEVGKQYYYGIFPYDTKGDYRFTKVVTVNMNVVPDLYMILLDYQEQIITPIIEDSRIYSDGNVRWQINSCRLIKSPFMYTSVVCTNKKIRKHNATKLYIDIEALGAQQGQIDPSLHSTSKLYALIYNEPATTYHADNEDEGVVNWTYSRKLVTTPYTEFAREVVEIDLTNLDTDFYIGFETADIDTTTVYKIWFDSLVEVLD